MTIDASNVVITNTAEEGNNLVTRDANNNVISSIPLPTERVNQKSLEEKLHIAIDNNVTWISQHAARQAIIDQAISDATAGKTASVTNVAQAQTTVRQLSDLCLRLAHGLDALETRNQALTRQLVGLERQLVGRLEDTAGS